MDDVLGQVVLTRGNEDFAATNLIGTVSLRFSLGANQPQVGAGVRLGQAHGAGPDTGIHVRQKTLFERLTGVVEDRQASSGSQHRVQSEGQAG
ncbi:hypothetical protein D3C85_1369320 [compost metagenome]